MPKKPTGKIGPDRLTVSSDEMVRQFKQIKFPTSKEEIEALIISLFAGEGKKLGFSFESITRNPENHFDYTLDLPGGRVYLDLAEVIYRDGKGSPYTAPNGKIFSSRFAEQIRDLVLQKSQHYGVRTVTPIHLLLYVTHWRFIPDETVIRLAKHYLKQRVHIIENIFLLIPQSRNEAILRALYPSRNPLKGRHPNAYADHWYLLGDLDTAEFDAEHGTITMKLPL